MPVTDYETRNTNDEKEAKDAYPKIWRQETAETILVHGAFLFACGYGSPFRLVKIKPGEARGGSVNQ